MVIKEAYEFSNTATAAAIAKFTVDHRAQIYESWKAAIRSKSTMGGDHILDILQHEYESNTDLLTIFGFTLTGQIHAEISRLHGLVEKVRTKEYSVSELYYEIFSLQDAFEATFIEHNALGDTDITANLNMTRNVLGRIFSAVLEQTSWIYEHVTESGKRGFCQMDQNGHITYCNSEMERIFEGQNIRGERLDQLFPTTEQEYVRNSITSEEGAIAGSRELEIPSTGGGTTTVWAEIEPVIYENEYIGSYAMFTDISQVAQREFAVFDSSPWCVVKVDSLGLVTYANTEAMSLFNIDSYQGCQVSDFVKGEDREILIDALKSRHRGESGAYRISITPNGDNSAPVEVDICGVPITDAEGHPVGSIGIFHSRMIDNTSEAIHAQIAGKHDAREMLKAVAEIIHELIPFDVCVVTRYSEMDDQQLVHANPFFTYSPAGDMAWVKKWTALSEPMVRWMHRNAVEPYILDSFLQLDEWKDLANDPNVEQLQQQGYKSFIFRVVGNDQSLVSSFSLLSKNEKVFDEQACDILQQLPLDKAMLMALHQQEISEMEFRYDLVKDIARAPSLIEAAKIFVQRLQSEYEWLHVSLFRVERHQKKLVLQWQEIGRSDSMQLPKGYGQRIDEGLLGECLASKKIINNGNVRNMERFKPGIIGQDGDTPTRSELCCPIWSDGEIHWLLNIEDVLINAFSSREEQAVIQACDEFGVLIERLSRHFSFQACFESTTDSVIITDNVNNIVRANASAKMLLGDDSNSRVAGTLDAYFKDKQMAQVLLNETRSAPTEVTLHKDGSSKGVNMLMSCCELPEEFGEKVYISKDLSGLRRMEELEFLSQLSYEVAAQAQSSMSLAFTWLRRLRDNAESRTGITDQEKFCTDIAELTNKVMRQLRKVQSTYDRMAFYDDDDDDASLESEQPIKLNLVTEIKRMLDDFPESDSAMVTIPDDESVPYIMADPVSISFILESLFSYLLRYAAEDRKINVDLTQYQDRLQLTIAGSEPIREVSDQTHERFLERIRTDIAIGRRRLKKLIESQHGQLIKPEREDGRIIFRMEFPVNRMESVA